VIRAVKLLRGKISSPWLDRSVDVIHNDETGSSMKDHKVRQGDCISSIAYENGFFWQTLWDHPNNAELKEKRKTPNILLAGDVVHIPDKRIKRERASVTKNNVYQIKGVPARIRLAFYLGGEPRKNEPYKLEVDGQLLLQGVTDENGIIEAAILPTAKTGKVTMGEGPEEIIYDLRLGHLDPVTENSGIEARLRNLGYLNSENPSTDELRQAIKAFQATNGLELTGQVDDDARKLLTGRHEQAS
jgi:hypothetical protein